MKEELYRNTGGTGNWEGMSRNARILAKIHVGEGATN
jgi:hypothetical protein